MLKHFKKSPFALLGLVAALAMAKDAAEAQSSPAQADSNRLTYRKDILPIFLTECSRCHNSQAALLPDWSDYHTTYAKRLEIKRRVWDSWNGNYHKQAMPAGNSREACSITEQDRAAIRDWVLQGSPEGVAPVFAPAQNKADRIQRGAKLFNGLCAACHQANGQGIAAKYPPLAHSDYLNADKSRAIRIVLQGLQGPVTVNGQNYVNNMPVFPLGDEDIANVLTFAYDAFGNSGQEVSPEEVKQVRAEKPTPSRTTAANPAANQFE